MRRSPGTSWRMRIFITDPSTSWRSRMQEVSPRKNTLSFICRTQGGGTAPSRQVEGNEAMKDFLASKLRLRRELVESTLKELTEVGSVSVPNLHLRTHDLKRVGML